MQLIPRKPSGGRSSWCSACPLLLQARATPRITKNTLTKLMTHLLPGLHTSIYIAQLQVTRCVEKLSRALLSTRLQVPIGVVLLQAKSKQGKENYCCRVQWALRTAPIYLCIFFNLITISVLFLGFILLQFMSETLVSIYDFPRGQGGFVTRERYQNLFLIDF